MLKEKSKLLHYELVRKLILNSKIYCPQEITAMLCPYELNSFVEKLNELMVVDDGITPMGKFAGIQQILVLKIITHGDVEFMSWIQYCKETYL